MFVGVCRLVLHLRENSSLKGKRRVVRSLIDRTRAKFNVSVAEVSDNDEKKRAVIGFTVVSNTASHVDSMLGRIHNYIEWLGLAPVASVHTEVIPIGGELGSYSSFHQSPDVCSENGESDDDFSFEEEEW
ncbi:MAG: DUF503 domain-containing protein [Proteobacteria bacterium]|nr:DUF503 domain-containing protein [Pseudomonadota bacterium]